MSCNYLPLEANKQSSKNEVEVVDPSAMAVEHSRILEAPKSNQVNDDFDLEDDLCLELIREFTIDTEMNIGKFLP